MKAVKNINIILPDKIIEDGLLIFNEKIREIRKFYSEKDYQNLEVIDGKGDYISPGFIDIHIHGSGGSDTMDAAANSLAKISKSVLKDGVTSYLPTTVTMELESIYKVLDTIKKYLNKESSGAQVLGVNVEGPFINCEKKGAQPEEGIINPKLSLFDKYLDIIKIMTVAVEKPGALELIEKLNNKGIITSLGHSTAKYEEVMKAQQYGLELITHLYNAMTGLHHRQPGIVGAALNSNIKCELIADGIHIHPAVLELTTKIKSADEIILVTDSIEAAGLKDGEYNLGGQKVIVKKGSARLEDGTLAGSVLTMDQALRNMLKFTDLELPEVVKMMSLNPAKLLNMDYKIGQIKKGLESDLVILNKELKVKEVLIKGESKYKFCKR
jgi:N-acetylglucosamine-6-phosphate deacetylase